MGFSLRHISILSIFLLTACTGTGGAPFGGTGGPSALDSLPGGSAAVGESSWGEAEATPDRTGTKIDLDPGGYPKYLFLAREDMIGTHEGLYDPEKCQKLMDCSVYYTTCETFNQQTVTWGDEQYKCEVMEWMDSLYYPEKGTQLDCRHMLPCGPLQVAPLGSPEDSEISAGEVAHILPPCGMEYRQDKTIQEGDQCRLPSWPEDLWMDCPSFHDHCEKTSPQVLQLAEDTDEDENAPWEYEIDPNTYYGDEPVDLQPIPPQFDL